ncbi:proline-rich protein 13-like [Hippopotamus amphibius kiboko]|uniref:proline-rich protein 13-like n=1 Tax=Hippopotamus amphibius kiboko TaxID=575201 RepID=UPI0025930A65|nr:proline-rich protein 13-like [Hippopotamus amphibius kiboko]
MTERKIPSLKTLQWLAISLRVNANILAIAFEAPLARHIVVTQKLTSRWRLGRRRPPRQWCKGWRKHPNVWNPNAGHQGPCSHPPNVGYPGGCNPAHLPPANPVCPPGPFPTPPGAPQGNPAFPPCGPCYLVPQPGYPGCQPSGPYPPPYPLPAPGMRPVNPLTPGMVGSGIVIDKKMQKKMKKAHKKKQKHHKHGKHSSSSSSSSSSSDSD